MEGIAVEITGVPNVLPSDRMVDKLTIHFLRPRHGGGEVQRVIFPSYRSGQAFVIFEEPEVAARVLRSTHVLKLEKQHYPLDVRPADRPEVDLPVDATLDVSMFPDERAALQLLTSHAFEVTRSSRGYLCVQGSFLKLRAVKAQLQKLLPQDAQSPQQPHSDPTPPSLNGFNHDHASDAIYKSPGGRMHHTNSTGTMPAGSRSPIPIGGQATYDLPSSPTSSSSRGSGSPRHLSTPPGYEAVVSQGGRPVPRPGSEARFITDAVGLRYAQCFRMKDIDVILESCNVKMDVEKTTEGTSDISAVTLKGRSSELAMEKLKGFLNELGLTLRTQEIQLASLDHDSQVRVGKQAMRCKDVFPSVLVSQVGDTLRLVGPSRDSYEMMQSLSGKTVDMPAAGRTGRAPERRSRDRRSSSLPRTIKTKGTRDVDDSPTVPDSGAAGGYSSYKYQDAPGRGVAGQEGGGPLPSPPTDSHRQRRSNSESRGKVREQRVAQREDKEYVAVAPPAVSKSILPRLRQKFESLSMGSTTEIKNKMTRKSTKK